MLRHRKHVCYAESSDRNEQTGHTIKPPRVCQVGSLCVKVERQANRARFVTMVVSCCT